MNRDDFIRQGLVDLQEHNRLVAGIDPNDPWISRANNMINAMEEELRLI
jgi:hypothetical protein